MNEGAAPSVFPHPVLIADIGGTNARFALIGAPGAPPSPAIRLRTGDFRDLTEVARAAIARGGVTPASLVVAAAGPVLDRRCRLTNAGAPGRPFVIDGPAAARELGLAQGLLLNDFEALSLSLPFLGGADLLVAGGGAFDPAGPRAVIGAGTGLGVGALIEVGGRYVPLASEGGHAGLTLDGLACRPLRRFLGEPGKRLSGEDLLSGRGFARLAEAAARRAGAPQPGRSAETVTRQALDRSDASAADAVDAFLELTGSLAGDAALMFAATGGVFIGGGIAPRFADRFAASRFRQAFEAKRKGEALLAGIGTALIVADNAALRGLAALAAGPDRFALDLAARLWVASGAVRAARAAAP